MKSIPTTLYGILFLAFLIIGNVVHATSSVFTRNLTLKVSGEDVFALQQFLITDGFLKNTEPTGYFGVLTKDALRAWQTSAGISATGFFGPLSRGKISEIAPRVSIGTSTEVIATTSLNMRVATTNPMGNVQSGLPTRLTIPKLSVDAGFQYNGLKSDGTMEIPNNVTDVGWFTGSVYPGEKGVAVVTGHVAQIRGGVITKPGVFKNLNELRPGDKLYVKNDRGITTTFVVRESRNYDPQADATDVFTAKDKGVHLNLITCEGTWNPIQLSYSQRLVVFTNAIQ